MNSNLKNYILSEARTDWICDLLETHRDEQYLCEFVERMVIDALMDSQVALMYLKEQND